MVVRKQVKSIKKYGIAHKLVFKTKGTYMVLKKATPISYWLQILPIVEGLVRPGRKMKESSARMEKIPSSMMPHKHVDGADTRFSTMTGILTKTYLGGWLGLIIIGTYQAASEDSRWEYEPVSCLWPYIEPDIESCDYGSIYELSKYQENPDSQEEEEVVSVPRRNPRRLRWGNKKAMQLLKNYIENSNDNLFFVKHITTGSAQAKWYLVQVDMDQSDPVTMRYYMVYQCRWYIRHREDFANHPIMECLFWSEIIEMQQDGTFRKMWTVIPLQVNDFLKKSQGCVWYQDDISLDEHRLVGTFQFGTIGSKKLNTPT